jgi:hypothetical protein
MIPDLEQLVNCLPRGSKDISDKYVLLRAAEKHPQCLCECEAQALNVYLLETEGKASPGSG